MYLCLVYYYTIYNFDSKAINCYLKNILNPNEHPYYELLTNENYIYRNDSVQETYNGNGPFVFVMGATKISTPNHTDPYYSDVCYTITREMCDMCCLVDFEFCSRDIGICNPVSDRNLNSIVDCVKILGGILFGIPLFSVCCKCFLSYRFCVGWFSVVGGVSCFELIMRCLCSIFCIRFGEIREKPEEVVLSASDVSNRHGICYYVFCCCLF